MNHHPHINDCHEHIYIPSVFIFRRCMSYQTIPLILFVFRTIVSLHPLYINYMCIGNYKQMLLISSTNVYSTSSTPPCLPSLSAVVESTVARGGSSDVKEPDADLAPRPSMYIVDTVLDVAVGRAGTCKGT